MSNIQTLNLYIRASELEEDPIIANHFQQMWLDLDIPESAIRSDWLSQTTQFLDSARQSLNYAAFVAEVDHRIIGSASCQQFAGLYPNILTAEHRQYGYIWGVYVEPNYRRKGIAKQLTQATINYLKSIGCTHAILNASPMGKPVYEQLGFQAGNTMQLNLV